MTSLCVWCYLPCHTISTTRVKCFKNPWEIEKGIYNPCLPPKYHAHVSASDHISMWNKSITFHFQPNSTFWVVKSNPHEHTNKLGVLRVALEKETETQRWHGWFCKTNKQKAYHVHYCMWEPEFQSIFPQTAHETRVLWYISQISCTLLCLSPAGCPLLSLSAAYFTPTSS